MKYKLTFTLLGYSQVTCTLIARNSHEAVRVALHDINQEFRSILIEQA